MLARRSGIPTTILTVFDDGFPHLSLLRGIRIERVRSPGRTRFENTYRADGSRTQRLLDRASPIPGAALRAEVRRLPPGSAVLHAPVAGELDGAAPLPLPRRIARDGGDPRPRAGAIVQGFLRRWDASGRISTGWSPEVRKRMAGLDLLSLAEEELPAGDLPAAPVLAVTRGVRGALVLRPGRPEVAVPALPARAVDPTGAGDVFGAALFLLLWRGAPVHRAARIAAAAAAISIESVGVEGVPSLSEATARAHQER